jgi:PHD/YefM family antitoxin component YafN of YafNO toxin-antitoxin module
MLPEQRWDDVRDAARIPSGDATRSLRPLGGALELSVNNQNPILTCTRNVRIISTHRCTEISIYVKFVREVQVLRTASVSELRSDLSTFIAKVEEGPIVVMSRSHPAAILLDPEVFEALIENAETLEDILDGRIALAHYSADPNTPVDAEEVFARLGL